MSGNREHFGGRAAVIMAMAGSAIGLGNIWRFPYMAGEYGGAAFILIYIACSLVLSLPIFLSEAVIGRRTHANAIGAMKQLAPRSGWMALGYLSVITPIVIASYYCIRNKVSKALPSTSENSPLPAGRPWLSIPCSWPFPAA